MRPNVRSLAFILCSVSLAQAAAYNKRQETPTSSLNLADGFMNIISRLGGTTETVTETVRQTITVGGDGGAGEFANATGAVTVTVTAPASTVTLCPGQAQGAVEGTQSEVSSSAASSAGFDLGGAPAVVIIATGGVGVSIIPVPEDARKTTEEASQRTSTSTLATASEAEETGSSLTPLPTLVTSSELSGTPAATSLESLPSLETSDAAAPTESSAESAAESAAETSAEPTVESSAEPSTEPAEPSAEPTESASVSETENAASATSLAPLPGLASSLTNTLVLPPPTNAPVASPILNPGGAFGGSVGLIPMESAEIDPPTPTTPAIANGAARPIIDVSTLTLSSQLNLGNLGQPTPAARA